MILPMQRMCRIKNQKNNWFSETSLLPSHTRFTHFLKVINNSSKFEQTKENHERDCDTDLENRSLVELISIGLF